MPKKKQDLLRAKNLPGYFKEPKRELTGRHVKATRELGLQPEDIPPYLFKYPLKTFLKKVEALRPELERKRKLLEEMRRQRAEEMAKKKKKKKRKKR